MVGVDLHRLDRDLGRDSRVAVAIAADPAPEPDERRGKRRARPGVVGGEGGVEVAVDLGHSSKQCLVEDRHHGADLVEWMHRGAAELGGTPQRSEEHTSELQSHLNLVCRLLLEKKKKKHTVRTTAPALLTNHHDVPYKTTISTRL